MSIYLIGEVFITGDMNVDFEEVSLDFVPLTERNHVANLQVSKNIFTLITICGQLYVIDLDSPEQVGQYQLDLCNTNDSNGNAPGNGEIVLNSWLSEGAKHLLIKTNFNKYHYINIPNLLLSSDSNKIISRQILSNNGKKANVNDIRLVQWLNEDQFLCSTNQNEIFWVSLIDNSIKLLLNLSNSRKKHIDGFLYSSKNHIFLLIVNDSIMYWSIEEDNDLLSLNKNFNHPLQLEKFDRYIGSTSFAKRRFHSNNLDQFVWITGMGIIYGNLNSQYSKDSNFSLNDFNVFLAMELPDSIDYNTIKDVIVLEYFIILLFDKDNRILIINKLNNKIVFDEGIDTLYSITNLIFDPLKNTIWLTSDLAVYEMIIKDSSEILWDLLCQQNEFQKALNLDGLKTWQIDLIHYKMANYYLSDSIKNFNEGSKQLAISNSFSISSNILKILDLKNDNDRDLCLQTYLLTKLKQLFDRDPQEKKYKVQFCLLTNWIIRNYIKCLNSMVQESMDNPMDDSIRELEKIILQFCETYKDLLDFDTVYQIVSNYEKCNHLLIEIATLNNNWQFILKYWIKKENWYESLKILNKIDDLSLIYQYSTTLLINCPELTIEKWMQLGSKIDPVKLIPSILNYFTIYQQKSIQNDSNINFGLTYLQWYINNYDPKDKIIYNTTLYMLISDHNYNNKKKNNNNKSNSSTSTSSSTTGGGGDDDDDDDKVIKYLNQYGSNKYDINFILRLSLNLQRTKVSIHLMIRLKLFENAINLSLEHNFIDLAKETLDEIDDKLLKKKLFLRLAEKLLCNATIDNIDGSISETNNDIKAVIRSIIKDSNGLVQIKDLLPIFNDMITMGNIKDEILTSLDHYNESMNNMNKEIKNSIKLKKIIVEQMKTFNERYEMLEANESCDLCNKLLTIRKFVVFPCNHCFHCDCLIKMIYKSNDIILKNQLEVIQKKILSDKKNFKKNQELISKLESLMTTKCCLCSDISINTIDESLNITQEQLEKWEL